MNTWRAPENRCSYDCDVHHIMSVLNITDFFRKNSYYMFCKLTAGEKHDYINCIHRLNKCFRHKYNLFYGTGYRSVHHSKNFRHKTLVNSFFSYLQRCPVLKNTYLPLMFQTLRAFYKVL
jgi:hypothetical protein